MKVSLVGKWYKCYGCAGTLAGKGSGGLVKLISLLGKVTTQEAIQIVLRTAGFTETAIVDSVKKAIPRLIPQEAKPLSSAYAGHPAIAGLFRRHVEHLIPHSYYCADGRYSSRWIFPIWNAAKDELLGFDAKTYSDSAKPKSLLADWISPSVIYRTHEWNDQLDFAVITESILDAETLRCNGIGLLGSSLREGQMLELMKMRKNGISRLVWFLDYDAWKKQSKMIIRNTFTWFDNYVVILDHDSDPNSLGGEECWRLVSQARYVNSVSDVLLR